jgi:hypothetical protein
MRSIDTTILRLSFALCFLTSTRPALAQTPWLGVIPQQQVGCTTGQGTVESIDFAKLLRDRGKSAGAIEIGHPFLTKVASTGIANGASNWEACAIYKGSAQATSSFEQKTLPASSAAFTLCEGTEAKTCSDGLVSWIKTKSPDFDSLTKMIPLFAYSSDKLDATKQSVNTLVSQTFLITGDDTPSKVPDPETELDKQLYGPATQPRQPRQLLDKSQFPPLPDFTKKGGEKHYNAILVFVPISEAQRAALEAP